MESTDTQALIQMCRLRFRSFSEAADSILDVLGQALPGTVVLGRLEPGPGGMRVIGLAGEVLTELSRGSVLPVQGEEIDHDALGEMGIGAVTALPLELGDGRIVGALAALGREPNAFDGGEVALLGIAARLLSFEWESVERRAELGRLRNRLPESPGLDPETSLPDRSRFIDLIDHDWQLARRGTVDSVIVAFEVSARTDSNGDNGEPLSSASNKVALKLAADTLGASVRATDRVGRPEEDILTAGLVGCRPDQAQAFIDRYLASIERISRGGSPRIELRHGVFELAAASFAEEAVDLAIDLARSTFRRRPETDFAHTDSPAGETRP